MGLERALLQSLNLEFVEHRVKDCLLVKCHHGRISDLVLSYIEVLL